MWLVRLVCLVAYVFERNGGVWTQQAKLTAIFDTEDHTYTFDHFGKSVSIYGDKVVVGSPYNGYGSNGGSAFVFGMLPLRVLKRMLVTLTPFVLAC